MDNGYVLVHVLEASVPGQDLGESPSCEIFLGDTAMTCPIPSTLQSETVALPLGSDPEPIIHVRAYSSLRGGARVGLVVVPVNTLLPLEVWNVWYAMDGEGDEDFVEKPPEETPKMHLLLQCVSAEAAAQETPQLREMRAQDFLLRALQQLNASLEAKVTVNQGKNRSRAHSPTLSEPLTISLDSPSCASGSHPPGDLATGIGRGSSGAAPPGDMAMRSLNLACTMPNVWPTSLTSSQPSLGILSPPRSSSPRPSPMPTLQGAGSVDGNNQACHQEKVEELLQRRVEPYERVIEALEDRQKLYDDQESRVSHLARALEAQEHKTHEFYSKLQAASKRCSVEEEQEHESSRRVLAERCSLEQQIAELQQEVALRSSREDSLQKRVTLMENELSTMHQKCALMDSVEERAQSMQQEAASYRESRALLEEKLEEQTCEASKCREEVSRLRDDHKRELEQVQQQLFGEQHSSLELRSSQQAREDAAMDEEVERRLRQQKFEEMARQISSLEGEVASGRSLLDIERQHRRDVERKFEEEQLQTLHSIFDEHRQTIKTLREDVAGGKKELQVEHARASELQHEVQTLRGQLGQEHEDDKMCKHRETQGSELRDENQRLLEQNEALRAQLQTMQQETRKMAEHYGREFGQHSQNEHLNSQERTQLQQQAGELRGELAKALQQLREVQMAEEQAVKSCTSMRDAAERSEDLQRQLLQAQDEVRTFHETRGKLNSEIERLTSKFRGDILKEGGRASEMEAVLEDRNQEIKLLMYRVQELSSKYTATRSDPIDVVVAKWVQGYKPAVPFFRLAQGVYLFGRRQVSCKIANDKPVFRVGGGFIGFDKFLELYASEELERLLSYDMYEKSGEPKFVEAQKIRQAWEESGQLDEVRDRVDHSRPKSSSRGPSTGRQHHGGHRSMEELHSARSPVNRSLVVY